MQKSIELLSPAKNLECGMAAINCGADAVYIGAPCFGARAAAGNSLADLEQLTRYAHRFHAKIFITINTILKDNELEEARQLIYQLYDIGCDALIIQDMGLLRLDLPPIALHASTQTDNRTPAKVKFLQDVGFQRVVLARELSLSQISDIHQHTDIELEAFIHGALCVSYSGQCYMSQAACGRSANRGRCAQYCRLPYSLVDAKGNTLLKNKHLLSLKDMDRSDFLSEMIEAGVTSFKIEGRLKDSDYVKNITAYYRQHLDAILEGEQDLTHASFGKSIHTFEPNPEKTFHRGKTDYFLQGKRTPLNQPDTPKSIGEYIGKVKNIGPRFIQLDSDIELHNGDGLCFTTAAGEFAGMRINKVENGKIFFTELPHSLTIGSKIHRNLDTLFQKQLEQKGNERRLAVKVRLSETTDGFLLTAKDESGDQTTLVLDTGKVVAAKPEQALHVLQTQFSKLGDTIFVLAEFLYEPAQAYFFPASQIAEWRRELIEALLSIKDKKKPESIFRKEKECTYPDEQLTYSGNVMNEKARQFYSEHGVREIAPAFESSPVPAATVMQCKYCLRHELGQCKKNGGGNLHEPLYLVSQDNRFQLVFDCERCEMKVVL